MEEREGRRTVSGTAGYLMSRSSPSLCLASFCIVGREISSFRRCSQWVRIGCAYICRVSRSGLTGVKRALMPRHWYLGASVGLCLSAQFTSKYSKYLHGDKTPKGCTKGHVDPTTGSIIKTWDTREATMFGSHEGSDEMLTSLGT